MSHDNFREWLHLAIAEEISDDQMSSLKEHLTQCDSCRAEFHELRQMKTVLGESGTVEPSEQMLWDARERLFDKIRQEVSPQSVLARVTQHVTPAVADSSTGYRSTASPARVGWQNWFSGFRLALSGAAAVVAGVFVGYLAFGRSAVSQPQGGAPFVQQDHAMGSPEITNVRFVKTDEASDELEVRYDLVRPVRLRAVAEDTRMQRMLTHAMVNSENPGVRLQAIHALDGSPQPANNGDVKNALIEAVTSDPNAGVRRQSLLVLQGFPFDDDIKQACLDVLSNDRNPGLRVAAINTLSQAAMDGHVDGPEILDIIKPQLQEDTYLRKASSAFGEDLNVH